MTERPSCAWYELLWFIVKHDVVKNKCIFEVYYSASINIKVYDVLLKDVVPMLIFDLYTKDKFYYI